MYIVKFIVNFLKRIYRHFDDVPEHIELINLRFYTVSNLGQTAAWITHFVWMTIFYSVGLYTISLVQIASILIYVAAINLNRKGHHMASMTISIFEIVLHQIYISRCLGGNAGFQYYIPVVAIFPFLLPKGYTFWKWIIMSFCLLGFYYIEFKVRNTIPLYSINNALLIFFNTANIALAFALFAMWAIYLTIAVNRSQNIIEEKTKELARVEQSAKEAEMQIKLEMKEHEKSLLTLEKKKYEELLLNILPFEIAQELSEKGISDAKMYESITVMFTDFKGFTQIAEKLAPVELVSEIDYCFRAFDDIIIKNNIEKIKTIGDSYMAAGGLPVENDTHVFDVLKACIEIRQFMQEYNEKQKLKGKDIFEIRIGVHTGPVVAGIVGKRKFAYDIWGDTVNLASRMEQHGESSKINVSETTFQIVRENYNCTYRGKIEAKNKGKVDMYFVEPLD